MELNSTIEIQLEKQTKKVKCHKFFVSELNRDFAAHESANSKDFTTVSDFITGYKAFSIKKKIDNIKQDEINQRMQEFLSHYTIKEILKKLKEIEDSNGK